MRDPPQKLGLLPRYRTWRVLAAIGERPMSSNREVANAAGIKDSGQASKLLKRLEGLGLIENTGLSSHGKPNAWRFTAKGSEAERALEAQFWI